jgi:hypothetical protein
LWYNGRVILIPGDTPVTKKRLDYSTKVYLVDSADSVDETIKALRRLIVVLRKQLKEVLAELRRLEKSRRD